VSGAPASKAMESTTDRAMAGSGPRPIVTYTPWYQNSDCAAPPIVTVSIDATPGGCVFTGTINRPSRGCGLVIGPNGQLGTGPSSIPTNTVGSAGNRGAQRGRCTASVTTQGAGTSRRTPW